MAFRFRGPRAGAASLLLAVSATAASAQSSLYDADFLRDLPGSRDVFSLLETSEPLTIADRWDGGGLYTGEAGRLSARGASWTQTVFQLDGLDISDPLAGGRPLILPWHEALEAMDVAVGGARSAAAGPGPLVALTTPKPQDAWKGSLALDGRLGGSGEPTPPAIARLDRWRRGAFTAAGPLGSRFGLLVSGQTASSARFTRGGLDPSPSSVHALLAGLTWKASERDRVRLTMIGQKSRIPYTSAFGDAGLAEDDRAIHASASWERRADSGASWTLSGGVLRARAEGEAGTRPRTIERLLDGPAALLAVPGQAERSRIEFAGHLQLAPRSGHALMAALHVSRGAAVVRPASPTWTVAEQVDGLPARVWEFEQPGQWRPHLGELTAHVSDAWQVGSRLRVDAMLPLQLARGAGLSWTQVSPRLGVRGRVAGPLTAFASWSRDAHRLPLNLLAFGDPDAVRASSFRWNDRDGDGRATPSERGVLVSRSGPGAPIGSLDPSLPRPRTDEWRVGLEAALGPHVRARLEGIARESVGLWESVNTGVTDASYDVRFVPDPGGDIVGAGDDQLLPIYDRRPASFGRDALLLTSPPEHDSLYEGVEFQLLAGPPRARIWVSGTAHRAVGAGANRSFRPAENDQGLVGERLDDPNANTFERGRLFSDRAYTIKIAGAWHAPGDVRLGAVARYQDGQPFARVVVVPDLRQGADLIMAIPRGRARYTFAITVDLRVEKVFALGRSQVSAVLEAFNLLDNTKETEEDVVSGPAYRTPTFIQPPRTLRGGLRIAF